MLRLKRVILIFITNVIFMALAVSSISAQRNFTDVNATYWAKKAISWGVEHKVLDGYSDGSFAPGKAVTEAEFLKMVISAYESLPASGENWFDPYYAYAYEYGWYVQGLKDQTFANRPLLRKDAAIILSSAMGNSYSNDSANSTTTAITELYGKGLSNGKTEKTIEGFASYEQLTRAEAVQFVYNFANLSGIKKLKASVSDSDWAPYEKVDFSDEQALMDKHELFAKKYGLKVITYESVGWTFINLVSRSEPSIQETEAIFEISSMYKKDTDGTINWTVVTELDRTDPLVGFELLTRIFSFNTIYHDSIVQRLMPTIKEKGIQIDGRFSAVFGNLEIITRYDKESNNYYISSIIAP
jgi:hypothetical protein